MFIEPKYPPHLPKGRWVHKRGTWVYEWDHQRAPSYDSVDESKARKQYEELTRQLGSATGAAIKGTAPTKQEGRKDDADKARVDLFPGDAMLAISDILTLGAKKYADRNWEKGMRWGRVFAACMRHMWAWWQGKGPTNESFVFGELDDETGRSHLWHAGCCIVFLIAYEMRKVGEDDRPTADEAHEKMKWGIF